MPFPPLVRIGGITVALSVASFLAPSRPAAQAPAPTRYVIEDLSIPGAGPSRANAIDAEGLTVGATSGGRVRALRWDGEKSIHLDTLAALLAGTNNEAYAVSYQYIAGTFTPVGSTATRGFVFDGTKAIDIGSLGGADTYAFGVGEDGTVVGGSLLPNGREHAFIRYPSGAWQDLGTLGGLESEATAIGSGVTGTADIASGASRAFFYDGSTMRNLGTLGGNFSAGLAINGAGIVAGHSRNAAGRLVGFIYDTTGEQFTGMRSLGTLGGNTSSALAINGAGHVVGESNTAIGGPSFAFLYRDGQMFNLNSLIDPASGWVLLRATGINNSGQIVGYGTYQGALRAFRLLPPEDIRVAATSVWTDYGDGNWPKPIQAGREMTWAVGVENLTGAPSFATVVDTVTGPVQIVSAVPYDDDTPCAISGQTVTCTARLFEGTRGQDFFITVRTTGAGHFSHSVTGWSMAADPDLSNNSDGPVENTAVSLSAVAVTPSTIAGGKSASLRVWLTSDAPPSGFNVALVSSNPAVLPVPSSLGVPFDATRATNIVPKVVSAPTPVEITARYGLVTKTTTVTVVPPVLSAFSLSPTTVIGGCSPVSTKVTLSGSAPAAGGPVGITESLAAAQFPASILVAPGSSTRTISVPTNYVTTSQVGDVTARYGGVSKLIRHTVRPIRAKSLTVASNPVVGGVTVTGTVRLECASPSPIVVALSSSSSSLASPIAPNIIIAAGALAGSFSIETADVTVAKTVSIYARVYGVRASTSLKLNP
jgi:probable HAF family extracellular repeat protein